MNRGVDDETATVLLLCSRSHSEVNPSALSVREYNVLARWLNDHGLSITALLPGGELVASLGEPPIARERLIGLVQRDLDVQRIAEEWLEKGVWLVTIGGDAYPTRLRTLGNDAPPLLYGAGARPLLNQAGPALGVVGSRRVPESVAELAFGLGRRAGQTGVTIVSGGARGVDSAAMKGSLDGGGATIGVLADSLARMAQVLAEQGTGQAVLISPNNPLCPFNAGLAMSRNKYIYAMADVTVVLAAEVGRGGTWRGATEALQAQRRVYVWIDDTSPVGNQELLKRGAERFPPDALDDVAGWLNSILKT